MKKQSKNLKVGSPKEIADFQQYEKLFIKSEAEYTLPEIANKLTSGTELDKIERQMAAGVINDWLATKNAQIENGKKNGREKKFASDKERYDFHNAKRKKKRTADKEEI